MWAVRKAASLQYRWLWRIDVEGQRSPNRKIRWKVRGSHRWLAPCPSKHKTPTLAAWEEQLSSIKSSQKWALTVQKSLASWRWPSGCHSEVFRPDFEWRRRPMASRGGFPALVWWSCKGGLGCSTMPSLTAHSLAQEEIRWDKKQKLFTLRCVVIRHLSTEFALGWVLRNISITPKERDMTSMFVSKEIVESSRYFVIHVEF